MGGGGVGNKCVFPAARRARERVGGDFAQVFLHRADGLAEVHLRAQVDRHEAGQHLLGHVAQRQVGQVARAAIQPQPLGNAGHHAADVAVGDHGALGLAGGARGVDHQPHVIQRLACQRLFDGGAAGGLGAQALDLVEGGDQGAQLGRKAAQALGLHDDDFLQLRQLGQGGQQLVGLLLVLAHHDGDVRVSGHVGDLGRGTGGVDAHGDGADQARAHLGQHPLDAVLGDHAHVAAWRQAQLRQAQPEVAGTLVVARPAGGLPDAEVLLPYGHAPGIAARAFGQHLGQGEFGKVLHINDPSRCL
ncbi:MAG: hypothetical protein GAK34_00449 [Delftia tsuruhatensis]|nr:MAG: hypothetical protein GAK34_00449 [Delftia tsuruhatensis]